MRQLLKLLTLYAVLMPFVGISQTNMLSGEYFFNTDPGYDNGTPFTFTTPAPNVSSFLVNADVSALPSGVHALYIRTKDANARWSITNWSFFAKVASLPTAGSLSNIDKAEYFYNADPGYGNGTDIPLSPNTNITNFTFNANISSLPTGVHTLYVRTRTIDGKWSITNSLIFAKAFTLPAASGITNIDKVEYFFDADPGFGNGTDVPVTPNTNISSLLFNVNVGALATGVHYLYVRTRTTDGKWSITNIGSFARVTNVPGLGTASTIDKLEYFYDTDPGYGNGTDIPVTAATNINGLLFNAAIAPLSSGQHILYVRSRTTDGRWSLTNNLLFIKNISIPPGPTAGLINKVEYFFNTDPGYGNGTDVPITPAANVSGLVINANVASLPAGINTMYVRTRDDAGKWSITNTYHFAKVLSIAGLGSVNNIDKMEYFYDTDPGYGNGVNVPISANTNLSSILFNADVTSLSNGVHQLYVRSRDTLGKWSITNHTYFAKAITIPSLPTAGNIVRIEYFIDTDPGFGNGTTVVGLIAAPNISTFSFNANVTGMPNGAHKLYVRSLDETGKWSITNVLDFNGGNPTAIKLISFDATVLNDKKVKLNWITEQEENVDYYRIERSYDASSWKEIGKVTPVSSNSFERRSYELIDNEPRRGLIYYRLSDVERKGSANYAPVRVVRISDNNVLSSVFPNPNKGSSLNISSPYFAQADVQLTIMGSNGVLHYRQMVKVQKSTIFTLSGLQLASGNYYIKLEGQGFSEVLPLTVRN